MEFSKDSMKKFLTNFNYIEDKYMFKNLSKTEKLKGLMVELALEEQIRQNIELQKLPSPYIGRTINSVYGCNEKTRSETMTFFEIVRKNIIEKYLNIDGLELLFNEHFYDFEWDMHLEVNFEKYKYVYYRDHMEHQIRDMYMMIELLDNYGFNDCITRFFNNKTKSKLSSYVYNRHKEFLASNNVYKSYNELLYKCAKIYYCQVFLDFKKSEKYKILYNNSNYDGIIYEFVEYLEQTGLSIFHQIDCSLCVSFLVGEVNLSKIVDTDFKEFNESNFEKWLESIDKDLLVSTYVESLSMQYIIKSAVMISALFHDSTYPLCFFMRMQKRIGQYMPSMNAFINNREADIDKIVSLLRPSLLFTLVSETEIREKLTKNQKEYDMAFFLLLHCCYLFMNQEEYINYLSINKFQLNLQHLPFIITILHIILMTKTKKIIIDHYFLKIQYLFC